MRELANKLERLGCINRDIRLAVTMTASDRNQIAMLRAEFAFECSQLHNQLTAKLADHEHAQLASRLHDQFVAMRLFAAQHQHRWTTAEIARDHQGYLAMALLINTREQNFIGDALATIAAAVAIPAQTCAIAPEGELRLTGTG